LINSYYKAWQKRVKKLGVDTTSFEEGFSVPESDFKNRDNLAYEQTSDTIQLKVWGMDSTYKLRQVQRLGKRSASVRAERCKHQNKELK
jgi:hypothetical protein